MGQGGSSCLMCGKSSAASDVTALFLTTSSTRSLDSRIDHSVNCPVLLDWSYQRTNQTTRNSHVTTNTTNSSDHLCDVTEVAPNVTTVSTQTGNVTPDVLQRVLKPAADVTGQGQGQGQEGALQHSGITSAKVTQGQTGVKLTKSLMTGGGACGPRVSTNQNQQPHDTQKQTSIRLSSIASASPRGGRREGAVLVEDEPQVWQKQTDTLGSGSCYDNVPKKQHRRAPSVATTTAAAAAQSKRQAYATSRHESTSSGVVTYHNTFSSADVITTDEDEEEMASCSNPASDEGGDDQCAAGSSDAALSAALRELREQLETYVMEADYRQAGAGVNSSVALLAAKPPPSAAARTSKTAAAAAAANCAQDPRGGGDVNSGNNNSTGSSNSSSRSNDNKDKVKAEVVAKRTTSRDFSSPPTRKSTCGAYLKRDSSNPPPTRDRSLCNNNSEGKQQGSNSSISSVMERGRAPTKQQQQQQVHVHQGKGGGTDTEWELERELAVMSLQMEQVQQHCQEIYDRHVLATRPNQQPQQPQPQPRHSRSADTLQAGGDALASDVDGGTTTSSSVTSGRAVPRMGTRNVMTSPSRQQHIDVWLQATTAATAAGVAVGNKIQPMFDDVTGEQRGKWLVPSTLITNASPRTAKAGVTMATGDRIRSPEARCPVVSRHGYVKQCRCRQTMCHCSQQQQQQQSLIPPYAHTHLPLTATANYSKPMTSPPTTVTTAATAATTYASRNPATTTVNHSYTEIDAAAINLNSTGSPPSLALKRHGGVDTDLAPSLSSVGGNYQGQGQGDYGDVSTLSSGISLCESQRSTTHFWQLAPPTAIHPQALYPPVNINNPYSASLNSNSALASGLTYSQKPVPTRNLHTANQQPSNVDLDSLQRQVSLQFIQQQHRYANHSFRHRLATHHHHGYGHHSNGVGPDSRQCNSAADAYLHALHVSDKPTSLKRTPTSSRRAFAVVSNRKLSKSNGVVDTKARRCQQQRQWQRRERARRLAEERTGPTSDDEAGDGGLLLLSHNNRRLFLNNFSQQQQQQGKQRRVVQQRRRRQQTAYDLDLEDDVSVDGKFKVEETVEQQKVVNDDSVAVTSSKCEEAAAVAAVTSNDIAVSCSNTTQMKEGLDSFVTIDEMLAHGSREVGRRIYDPLFSVTSV